MPVLKPNEAMIGQAAAKCRKIGLLATFAPTLVSMRANFLTPSRSCQNWRRARLAALDRGDRAEHDRLVAEASRSSRLRPDCARAYSMAPAAALVARRRPAGPHDTG